MPERVESESIPRPAPTERAPFARRAIVVVALLSLACWILASTLWATLAIRFQGPESPILRTVLAAACALSGATCAVGLLVRRFRVRLAAAHALGFATILVWFLRISPSNDRVWQTDVAVLPRAEIDGDTVVVRGIRNFRYRTPTDFDPDYYDATFDLRKLSGVDLVASYWAGPSIAHILVSFAFEDGERLAISIETRKEVGETYSTLGGFFKLYELIYVVADERDVIRLRTSVRDDPPERVHIYPLRAPMENGRRLFLEYMRRLESLNARPEFYNTLTTNCTTSVWMNSRVNPGHVPFSWKLLLSGHVPAYLHEVGLLDRSIPFARIQAESLVDGEAAREAGADFSSAIRRRGVAPATPATQERQQDR